MKVLNSLIFHTRTFKSEVIFTLLCNFSRAKTIILREKPTITIFGSCRQDSLYSHFKVTKIRDGLTYPHFSKEVLQAIKYCKNVEPDIKIQDWIFRNSAIGKKILDRKQLAREFKRTDIFVVEIASLIEYKYQDLFLHHEIYDSYESTIQKNIKFSPPRADIEVREQTLEELKTDLQEIVKLLGKNRLVFATHFSTRSSGKRTELIDALTAFCWVNDIQVFNPTEMLEFYTEDQLFEKETVLSHFTPFGHKVAGYRLKELVERTYNLQFNKSKLLVQKFEKPTSSEDGFTSGYGDFLFGAAKVFEVSKKLGLFPSVDFSETALNNFYKSKQTSSYENPVKKIFHEDADVEFYSQNNVFTNKRPKLKFDLELRDFIFRNCLEKKRDYSQFINNELGKHCSKTSDFAVLHIRVSDKFDTFPEQNIIDLVRSIAVEIENRDKYELIVISNSNVIRECIDKVGIKVPRLFANHSSDPTVSAEDLKGTFFEFELMGRSKEIYSFSTYGWGSGFSTMASLIFNVPLTKIEVPGQ